MVCANEEGTGRGGGGEVVRELRISGVREERKVCHSSFVREAMVKD